MDAYAASIPFPADLRPYRPAIDQYLGQKLRQFGTILARSLHPSLAPEQVKHVIDDAMRTMAQQDAAAAPQRALRLVIRHDCQSTGCGDQACVLCQYNPSRLCTRNVKQKYLIDDHLKAKCGAPLRVELVDETGACHTEGLAPGVQLEMHVLNGEKYKELCPDNTLLSLGAIRNCIISHHTKALLRREGMADDQLRVYLPLERGAASVSDLTLTTSSEALLSGKAPTFRLLVWAVEANGEPVPHVTYVVSESFVVATKRVKHAIKSDIPSVGDPVSKLLHIGKATVDKLTDLRGAFQEEGFDVKLPESLYRVEKVGQFRQLVEMSEANNDLKNKLRHVLKLSPEKWDEVCQHALSAVVPDFRNRVWWYPILRIGLLYACKNGAIQMDNPIAVLRSGATQDSAPTMVPLQSLSPADFNNIPKLKQLALQSWYMANHPQWNIYGEGVEEAAGPGTSAGAAAAAAAVPNGPAPGSSPGAPLPPLLHASMAPGLVGVPQGGGQQAALYPQQQQQSALQLPDMGGRTSAAAAVYGGGAAGGGGAGDLYGALAHLGVPYGLGLPGTAAGGNGGLAVPSPLVPMGPGGMGPGAHRGSNSSPFALQSGHPSPPQPPQQLPQHPTPQAQQSQQQHQQQQHPQSQPPVPTATAQVSQSLGPAAAAVGAGVAGRPHGNGSSPFVAGMYNIANNIAKAFPDFPAASAEGRHGEAERNSPHAPAGAVAGGAGPSAPSLGSLLFPGSLEMLKTEDIDTMPTDMLMPPHLTGNDTFRSTDWLQQLHGPAAGGAGSAVAAQHQLQHGHG
ncbi:hypothetical protein Agub_g4453, partial [Astrephomene gubernaculifera]